MAQDFTPPPRPRRPPPAEVCLLLRSHAEAQWLTGKVVPLVRELEQPGGRPRNHMGDPYAYLEALWIEACGRAAETDGARVELEMPGPVRDLAVQERALRYHTAVRRLRHAITRRVDRLMATRPPRPRAAGRAGS
jgi:hypothetical protein